MNISVKIRRVEINDISLLTAISIETFHSAFASSNSIENMDMYFANNLNEEQLLYELRDNDSEFYFVYVDDELAGYCKLRKNTPPPELSTSNAIELERLYILSKHQNRKTGAALLQYCCEYAKENSYDVLWLGVWEHNVKAISFYKNWGFGLFGSHIFMLGNDVQTDLLMKKDLNKMASL